MTLTYIGGNAIYSEYRDRNGEFVYLAAGSFRRLIDPTDLNLIDVADEWTSEYGADFYSAHNRNLFRDYLRSIVIDPDMIDCIAFCSECRRPEWIDDMCVEWCEPCYAELPTCDWCGDHARETTETLSGADVCTSCRDAHYSYCDDCGGYYRDEDSDEHDHSGNGCCESPAMAFRMRNDGMAPLENDMPVTVTLPAGTISAEGISAISRLLRTAGYWDVMCDVDKIGAQWQTREGNYTKRLSRMAYRDHSTKLTPEILSQVGNIGAAHSTAVDFDIEVTRDLNLPADEFAHDDSCWWQSYSSSRCALKTNGGFGLRTFQKSGYGHREVSGRAWVMPMRLTDDGGTLAPTFDTESPDAFVVFNGYGALSGYAPARIIAHMAGWTYRKISFTCSPMYVNGNMAYLVAPEPVAAPYTDGALHISTEQHSDLYYMEGAHNVA